jgi:hypothetical protein
LELLRTKAAVLIDTCTLTHVCIHSHTYKIRSFP